MFGIQSMKNTRVRFGCRINGLGHFDETLSPFGCFLSAQVLISACAVIAIN